jgi:hypothetical protein
MRVTVIPEDKWIRRDGDSATLENWPFNDEGIHAIQWYDDHGEIERKGNPKPVNEAIANFSIVQPYVTVLDAYLQEQ